MAEVEKQISELMDILVRIQKLPEGTPIPDGLKTQFHSLYNQITARELTAPQRPVLKKIETGFRAVMDRRMDLPVESHDRRERETPVTRRPKSPAPIRRR